MKKSLATLAICLPLFIEIMNFVQDFILNHTTKEGAQITQPTIQGLDPIDQYRNLHEVIEELEAKHPATLQDVLNSKRFQDEIVQYESLRSQALHAAKIIKTSEESFYLKTLLAHFTAI